MADPRHAKANRSDGGVTWKAGGWVLALAIVLIAAVMLWRVRDMLAGGGERAVGDGRNPATYGFDLSNLKVPEAQFVGSGLPRDGLPVLDFPPLFSPGQVDSTLRSRRSKYLVSGDRVIGVRLNGQARAYPVNVLNWHEVVNDTLGGRPIAVTYSPLCDAAVVFDRRLGSESAELFGHSGLLYNSNLVLYDRRPEHRGESLWSQLQARAIAGPAAAEERALRVVPCALVTWQDWRRSHPETTVLKPDPARMDRYKRNPYVSYYGSDLLRFPTAPLPPEGGPDLKTRCLILGRGGSYTVYPLSLPGESFGRSGAEEEGVEPIAMSASAAGRAGDLERILQAGADGEDLDRRGGTETFYSFWFAWYACRPEQARLAR